jgi:hypothetical protein
MRQSHSKIMTSFVYAGLFGACLALASAMSPHRLRGQLARPARPALRRRSTVNNFRRPIPNSEV